MIGAQITEDFTRQMAGLDAMEGTELDRFQRRQEQDMARDSNIATIQGGLEGQAGMADQIAQSLRRAGLSDVAERYRRQRQQQAFNVARRGIGGGSYDVQAGADLQADAMGAGQQVAMGAEQARLNMLMQQMQEAGGLEQQMTGLSPFEQMMMGQEMGMAENDMQRMLQEQALQQQIAAARSRALGAWGTGIGGALGGLGQVGYAGLRGSA